MLSPNQKRTRTRNGCLTCRDRHLKCDEQKPVCGNCLKSSRTCVKGMRLNFSQYNLFTPEVNFSKTPISGILDQSLTVASCYKNGLEKYAPYKKYHDPSDLLASERQFEYDVNVILPPIKKQKAMPKRDSDAKPTAKEPDFVPPQATHENLWPNEPFDHIILENFDLTNILANPSEAETYSWFNIDTTEKQPDEKANNHSSSDNTEYEGNFSTITEIKIETKRNYLIIENKIKPITSLPESKLLMSYTTNSCWLMDLFNGKYIWKRIIPNFAISESTILNALLTCGASCYEFSSDRNFSSTIQTYKRISIQKQNEFLSTGFLIDPMDFNINENIRYKKKLEKLLLSTNLLLASCYYKKVSHSIEGDDSELIEDQFKIMENVLDKVIANYQKHNETIDSLIINNSIYSHILLDFLFSVRDHTRPLRLDPFRLDFLYSNEYDSKHNDSWWLRKILSITMKLIHLKKNLNFGLAERIKEELFEFEESLPIILTPIVFDYKSRPPTPASSSSSTPASVSERSSNEPEGSRKVMDQIRQELYKTQVHNFPKFFFHNEKALLIHILHHYIYLYVEKEFPPEYSFFNLESNSKRSGGLVLGEIFKTLIHNDESDRVNFSRRVCSMFLYNNNDKVWQHFSCAFDLAKSYLPPGDLPVLEKLLKKP